MNWKHIRPFTRNDLKDYEKISTSCKDIAKYVPGLVLRDSSDVKGIENIERNAVLFAVVADDGSLAGIIHGSDHFRVGMLNVAVFLAPKFRHHGIMYEAMLEFVEYCRAETFYSSLIFEVRQDNKVSLAAARKFGAKEIRSFETFGTQYTQFEFKL